MRARLEAELDRVAPMPALDRTAWLMVQTGMSYSELMAIPGVTLDDYLLIREAQGLATQGKG